MSPEPHSYGFIQIGLFLPFLLAFALANAAIAQSDPAAGIIPYTTELGGPYDYVNPATSNIILVIPVRHKTGKIPFSYDLMFNSHAFLTVPLGGQGFAWNVSHTLLGQPFPTGGWTGNQVLGCPDGTADYVSSGFYVTDNTGATHSIPNLYISSSTCNGGVTSATAMTIDGSGFTLSATSTGSGVVATTVYDRSGLASSAQSGAITAGITDPDGTQITSSYANGVTTYVDTLGATVLTVQGTIPSQGTPSYIDGNSNTQAFTQTTTPLYWWTAFNCNSRKDINNAYTTPFLTSMTIPGEGTLTISYEQTPGKGTNYTTGRIAKITFPSGGSVTYTYSGGNNGVNCISGVVPVLTRMVNDNNGNSGTWTYANSNPSNLPGNFTVTQTDPVNNQTVYYFSGAYQTAKWAYQGQSTGGYTGALLVTTTCYNGNFSNCQSPSAVPALPITQTDVYTWMGMTPQKLTETIYDCASISPCYGNVTEIKSYDWGAGNPPSGTILSDQIFRYGNYNGGACNALPNYIQDGICAYQVNGTVLTSLATYSYTGNHPTTVNHWVSGQSNYLVEHPAWNANGTLASVQDVAGNTTSFSYNGSGCSSLVPTGTTYAISSVGSDSSTWNCNGGVATAYTDVNGKVTSYGYADPLWRTTSATDALANTTNFYYSSIAQWSSLTFNGGSSLVSVGYGFDGIGQNIVVNRAEAPNGNYDTYPFSYDSSGRLVKKYMPCSASPSTWTCSTPYTSYTYDALNRPLVITDGGGGTVSYSYNGKDVLVTIGPAPSGEHTKQKQYEYDGLGRLVSVCEITNASGSGPCGQYNTSGLNFTTGYLTTYAYDPLDHLTGVAQNAQGSPLQTRSYSYDGIGRLTSEGNPESGTTTYTYDAVPSSCYNYGDNQSGNLVAKKDANGNTICYHYDAMHRLMDVGRGTGSPNSSSCRRFRYDNSSGVVSPPAGATVSNVAGRLAEAETDNCSAWPPTPITDEWFSYDADGRLSDIYESTPHSGGYYHTSVGYWPNGVQNTLGLSLLSSGNAVIPTQTYGVDGEGRPNSASATSGQNPVTGVTYDTSGTSEPIGALTNVTFGSGDSDSFQYDANTGRRKQYSFNINGQSDVGNLTWNSNATLQELAITDPFNSHDNQNCTYSYDDLARISGVGCGSTWAQSFSYDPFGNTSKSGNSTWQPLYTASKNQYQSGWNNISYDNNGNLLYDAATLHSYQWDAYGQVSSIDGNAIIYDALGRQVEYANGTYQAVYQPASPFRIAVMSGQNLNYAQVPLPGGANALYNSSGLWLYVHPDWLNSARLYTTPNNHTVNTDNAYAPFGENYAKTGGSALNFTGAGADTASGLYDFWFRKYSPSQSRWISPDPAGLAAVDPTNPQTWNRYAYVVNNPVSNTDPLGLECVWDNGSYDAADDPHTGTPGTCQGLGGSWVDHSYFVQNALPDWSDKPNSDLVNYVQNFTETVTATANDANSGSSVMQNVLNLDTCIKNNSKTYSIGGLLNVAFNTNVPGSGFLDNSVTSTALFLTGQDGLLKTLWGAGKLGFKGVAAASPTIMTNGPNSVTTITSKLGSPQPVLGHGTNYRVSFVGKVGKALGAAKGIADVALSGALVTDCLVGQLP